MGKQVDIPEFIQGKMSNSIIEAVNSLDLPPIEADEESKHLAELSMLSGNYSTREWVVILMQAPTVVLIDELKRRMNIYERYVEDVKYSFKELDKELKGE